jgi:hypothetical protein
MTGFTPYPDAGKEVTLPAFGAIEPERVLAVDDLFAVVSDKFPVSPGHTLIIPRRALTRFQELDAAEKFRLLEWVEWAQTRLVATLSCEGLPQGAVILKGLHCRWIKRICSHNCNPKVTLSNRFPATGISRNSRKVQPRTNTVGPLIPTIFQNWDFTRFLTRHGTPACTPKATRRDSCSPRKTGLTRDVGRSSPSWMLWRTKTKKPGRKTARSNLGLSEVST